MAGLAILYAAAAALFGAAVTIATGDNQRLWEGLAPLKRPLSAQGVRGSFAAVWDEPHQVIVWLPTRSGVPRADAVVEAAAARVGHYKDRPSFDLTWRVYEKGVLVGSGSGRSGADGVMYGDSSRGFSFGTFPVKAAHTYDVAVDVGSGFYYLLPAGPSVEVGVATATASVGLALGESFRKPLAWGAGTGGVVALLSAMWLQRSRRAAQQRDAADEVRDGQRRRGPRS